MRASRRFSTAQAERHSAPKPPASAPTAQEFCRQIVQQRDRDHYACAQFLPKKAQQAVYAVRAFNVEVASLRDVAKVPSSAIHVTCCDPSQQGAARAGRTQFWRQLVDETFKVSEPATRSVTDASQGTPPEQPIAKALAAALKEQQLTKGWFLRILDARVRIRDLCSVVEQPSQEKDLNDRIPLKIEGMRAAPRLWR